MDIKGIGYSSYVTGSTMAGKSQPTDTVAATPAGGGADTVHFSEKALALMKAQQVREEEVGVFADIILRARAQDGYTDPKGFLSGLNRDEMEVLRKSHGLADPIDIDSLDFEGAYNLLLPHDQARDLNNDAFLTIGAGRTITFPPANAPAAVKAAWNEATAGMSDMDRLSWELRMFSAEHLKNIHRNEDGSVTIFEPGDPGYRNPFAEASFSYQELVAKQLESLEYARSKGLVTPQRYQEESAFLSGFAKALKRHGMA